MIIDRNKNITEITYNHLNLPKKISFGTSGTIEYFYNANGEKLKKKVTEASVNKTVDYLGGFQYENENLSFFPTAEGYVKVTKTLTRPSTISYNYVYNHTDHLGNIRLRYTRDPADQGKVRILEENSYYPFGMKHEGYNGTHEIIVPPFSPFPRYPTVIIPITPFDTDPYQYKYQGQERQDELGLNWDSFKWRNYDYAIGRFMSHDPLSEKYNTWTPYAFSGNRVIDARELEGLEPHSVHATEEAAAQNWGEYYNGASILRGIEMGSTIYSQTTTSESGVTTTTYSYNEAALGTADATAVNPTIPPESTATADIHAHGEYLAGYENNEFSGLDPIDNTLSTTGDIGDNNSTGLNGYVTTPNGSLQKYEPSTGTVSTVSTDLQSDPKAPARLNTNEPVDNLPPTP